MSAARTVLELARGDFLERARRSGFLLTLAAAAGLAYTVHADVWTVLVGSSAPEPGPAATGTLVAVVTSTFLSLAAFYVVKGSVGRDLRTGVGPILAATPASRLEYAAAKFASNAAVLGSMLLLLLVLAVASEALRAGTISASGAWRVISPSLLIAAPTLAAVAGVAVSFDAIPWLRGAAGNVAYFFLWTGMLTFAGFDTGSGWLDVTGVNLVFDALRDALHAAHPGASAAGLTISLNDLTGPDTLRFPWSGPGWTAEHLARRLWWVGVGAALSGAAAGFLRLFDPFGDRGGLFSSPGGAGDADRREAPLPGGAPGGAGETTPDGPTQGAGAPHPGGAGRGPAAATGVAGSRGRTPVSELPGAGNAGFALAFLRTTRAELRLLLSDHAWWWYAGLAGANVAALFVPADAAGIPLLAAWLLPLSAWSSLGCRERLHGTESLLFSGPSPRVRQLPAQLAAGVALALLAAAVPLGRMAAAGDTASLVTAGVGSLFVPALALCLGAWTGKEKTFQAVYLVLWYLGPANEVPALDFMGVSDRTLEAGAPASFLAAATGLLLLAWLGRGRRLRAVG